MILSIPNHRTHNHHQDSKASNCSNGNGNSKQDGKARIYSVDFIHHQRLHSLKQQLHQSRPKEMMMWQCTDRYDMIMV
jgi:hypothetical protein